MPPQRRQVGQRYVLHTNLGSGGMGEVWSAYDEVLNRHVAIKGLYLHPEFNNRERHNLHIRSLREARAAARITSPTAVAVYDVIEDNQRPWIVMELIDGRSLAEVIRADGPLPLESVARIGLAMLEALHAAHAANVVHRDVKPANVLLATDGRVVLTDFGVATVDGDPGMTVTGMVMGSPAYMAPERAQGLEPTPGMDLWGLGATLFAAVEGKGPFSRKDALSTLHAVLTEPLPPMTNAGVLTPFLQGLLERDPSDRLTVEQARLMLLQLMRHMEGTAAEALRVPLTDASGMDTASLRVLTHLPPSVRNKPPMDMAALTGQKFTSQPLAPTNTARPRHPGSHSESSYSLLAAVVAIFAVVILAGTVWFGSNRMGQDENGRLPASAATALPLSTPAEGTAQSTISLTPSPASSLVPSAASDFDASVPAPAPGYQLINDPAMGYSMDLPEMWQRTEKENPPVNTDEFNEVKPIVSDGQSGTSSGSAIVQVQKLHPSPTLDSVIASNRNTQNQPGEVPGLSLISSDDYIASERMFHIEEYTWQPDKLPLRRVRQILIVKPNLYTFSVILSSAVEDWHHHQETFSHIIQSFRVLPSAQPGEG